MSDSMCVNPVTIRNPYFNRKVYVFQNNEILQTNRRFVSNRETIDVPCGHCCECRNSYFMSIQQRAQVEAMTSYVFMITLTYDNENIPTITFGTISNKVEKLYYADVSHIQQLFKRLRNDPMFVDRDFRYLHTTEFGSSRFRPHHHILLFVARHFQDTDFTVTTLESYLYSVIQKYYGRNVGTRKHPIYKPYFTYAKKQYNGKVYSNYQCELIRVKDEYSPVHGYSKSNAIAAAIAYTTTYVNKPSQFDELIEPMLGHINVSIDDKETYRKVHSILHSRVIYSKHFGFGFDGSAHKVNPTLQFRFISQDFKKKIDYLTLLPDSWDDFVDLYPLKAKQVDSRIRWYQNTFVYNGYGYTTEKLLSKLNAREQLNFLLVLKYFPKVIKTFYHTNNFDSRTYYPQLLPKNVQDKSYMSSVAYKYIRKSISDGISAKKPFLCFNIITSKGIKQTALCSYYKRYCATLDDLNKQYDAAGIVDYDDLLAKLEQDLQRQLFLANQQESNYVKHELGHSADPVALHDLKTKLRRIRYLTPDSYHMFNLI